MENRKLKICNHVLKQLVEYKQNSFLKRESGGIIVGRITNDSSNIILEYITTPFPNDVRGFKKFIRKDAEHIAFYQKLYKESQGVYAYMGEWHTHNERNPRFSSRDLKNWKIIGQEMELYVNNQYHIIVGYESFGIWCYDSANCKVKHLGDFNWERINF